MEELLEGFIIDKGLTVEKFKTLIKQMEEKQGMYKK